MCTLDESYYHPGLDEVHVPLQERFKTSAGCSHTCAHELAHASGHKKRLNYLEPSRFCSEEPGYTAGMNRIFPGSLHFKSSFPQPII